MAVSENLWNLLSGYMCVGFYILATERLLKYREAAQWPTIRKNTPTVQFMIIIYLKTGGWKIQKNGPVLEAFPDLDLDIWTRFSVYSTCDAWHFFTRDADIFRRSSYEKIFPSLSLCSDWFVLNLQTSSFFGGVHQHILLKSTRGVYKCTLYTQRLYIAHT